MVLYSQTERIPRKDFEIPFKELTTSQLIGQGAFGRVFKGRWRGTPVAVKMLVCQELTSDVVKEFRDEVAVLRYAVGNWLCAVLFSPPADRHANFMFAAPR